MTNSGALTNTGTLTNSGTLTNNGTINNSGTLDNTNGTVTGAGVFANHGTVNKGNQGAPAAPTQSGTATADTITLAAITTTGYGDVQYGYTVGAETSVPEDRWQTSPEFTGLQSGTNYTFYARYAGNDFYHPSSPSDGAAISTVPSVIDSGFEPAIIAGAGGIWQKGTEDGLSFTSNAAFADFVKVQVDGRDLAASDYEVREGSTIVTLKASYLETLSVGKHTLAIVSNTGTATTEFTIQAASAADGDTPSPQTSDNNPIALWIVLLLISGAGLSMTAFYREKRHTPH